MRNPPERRTKRATEVVANAVRRDCPGITGLGTSCGTIDSHAGVLRDQAALSANVVKSSKHRGHEIERHHGGEDGHQCRDRVGDGDDHPTRINDVGDGAGGKRKQKNRQSGCGVQQRDVEWIEVESRHQPAGRRVVHGDADQRASACRPDDCESRMGERAEH